MRIALALAPLQTPREMKASGFPRPLLPNSAARNDVSHLVSVEPVDDACIDVSHLEQRWNLWVSGTAIDPEIPTEISEP